jgi:hypothetical protein
MVAGTDIGFGNSLITLTGVIAAHEQISIQNAGTLTGMLIAENACDGVTGNTWPTCDNHINANTISGSGLSIVYNCDMHPAGLGSLASISKWLTQ